MKNWVKKNYNNVYLLSFIIATLILVGAWIILKIGPFGHRSLLIVDGLHQYIPFFSEYYDKLKSGESFLYSWRTGLGNDFVTLWAYYLSSPLNLLILLFKKEYIYVGASLIVSIKIVFSCVFFAYYLTSISNRGKKDLLVVAFALGYGFSNYVIGYYWNIMWMDSIMILPLIIVGLNKLIDKNDPRLYIITMFYSFWCNYYISFIICIFVCIWYIVHKHESVKCFFINGFKFVFYSILSAAMAAVVLIPSYVGIKDTASAHVTMPDIKTFYGSFVEIFSSQMFLVEPINNQVFDGGTNLYCGILPVMVVVMGLFISKIKLRDKIKYALVLIFFLVSFNNEYLNYIWHGFHNQYGIPNRFAILFVFVMLTIGYKVLSHIKLAKKWMVVVCYVGLIGFVLYSQKASSIEEKYVYIGTAVLLSIYFVVIMAYLVGRLKKKLFYYVISIIMIIEMIVSGCVGFGQNGSVDGDKFFSGTDTFVEVTNHLKELDDGFYRVDMVKTLMLDEAIWHNLNAVGIFGSTVQGDMVTAMNRLGFYTGANEYLYRGSTPLTNALLGVKYVIGRTGDYNNIDAYYLDMINGVDIYENPFTLPIGFVVNNLDEWNYASSDVFGVQNSFVNTAVGGDNIFSQIYPAISVTGINCVASTDGSNITYERSSENGCSVQVSFVLTDYANLYAELTGGNINKIRLLVNDKEVVADRFQSQAFHIGEYEKGTKINLIYELNDGGNAESSLQISLAEFNYDNFYKVYDELSKYGIDVTEYSSGYIKGNLNTMDSGTVFTSIPYNEGWDLYVDGQKRDTFKIADALLGFDINEGNHEIELKYTPVGLYKGLVISGVSFFLFLIVCILKRKKKVSVEVSNE